MFCAGFFSKETSEQIIIRNEEHFYSLPAIYTTGYNMLNITTIVDLARHAGYWNGDYAFGVLNEDEDKKTYEMCPKPFSKLRVDAGTIIFEKGQLDIYKPLVISEPGNKYLKQARDCLARQIAYHRKVLKRTNGFLRFQYEADYTIQLADTYARIKSVEQFIENFCKTVHKAPLHSCLLRVPDNAAGSAALTIQLVPRNIMDAQEKHNWEESKRHLQMTFKAISHLARKGEEQERVNNFCRKTKLDPVQANNILIPIRKIFPKNVNKTNIVEVFSKPQEKPIAKFNYEGADCFDKALKNLSDSLKTMEDTTISGFLGLIVGEESEKPRFVIETEEKGRITIMYDKAKTDEIKARFKTNVKLERTKVDGDWYLIGWCDR